MESWTATELLPKLDVPVDLLTHIKTTVGEEMFDSFRLYYGDDPERYNLSFEVIFGTYCNKMEWVTFLSTALASAAHTVRFDDLNRMTTGKMLFYIQVPRVATGTGIPASRQTTVMVTKYTEKSPITIPFELSAACLTHLRETFEDTLLDKLLNVDAVNTVLRAVKNTADSMERGLVDSFLKTLLRKAPPFFIIRTLLDNATLGRQMMTRVQRSNVAQSFKKRLVGTIFMLNRNRDRNDIYRFLTSLVDSVTESILDNPDTYVTPNGERLSGVLIGTASVVQTLLTVLGAYVSKSSVKSPASYGKFVLSKENAVTAVAHHAIIADFDKFADRMAEGTQDKLTDSQFFDQKQVFAQLTMDTLKVGEKLIALEHLRRVYKNTNVQNPLERDIDLTFYFPLGLFVPGEQAYTTVDSKIKLSETPQNELPTCVFFHNKDRLLQRITYSDTLRTLCHPVFNDVSVCFQIFAEAGPPREPHRVQRLCRREFRREPMGNLTRRLFHFYQLRREVPRTVNELKHDFTADDFLKTENDTIYTELHPFFDFTHHLQDDETRPLCTPRILVGNLPEPLAPADFHELRAKQILDHTKLRPPENCENTLRVLHETLTDPQYSETFYLIDVLIHGDTRAFEAAKRLIVRCVNNNFRQRGTLAFAHSYDMIHLIATQLGDGTVQPAVHAHYRTLLATVRFIDRVSSLTGLNGRLAEEPLLSYLNALYDPRLWPPIINALPRDLSRVRLVADQQPIGAADVETRNHGTSDVPRLIAMDQSEPLFVDERRLSDEELVHRKIYYLCIIPAMTNNRACGAGFQMKNLLVDLFYNDTFVVADESDYEDSSVSNDALIALLRNVATDDETSVSDAAKELFLLLPYVAEHAQILEIRTALDPAQRHGLSAEFESLQHVLYNGCCLVNCPQILQGFIDVVPFHRFYSDPSIAASISNDIRLYINDFPHYQRADGSFPLAPALSHEYHQWQRTPFSRYSAQCANTLLSAVTLASMHHKFSAVSTALQSRFNLHPSFALTLVRTDTFESDSMLYSTKSSTGLIINAPVVTKEDRDISTVFHVTQNINTVDMGFGYSSATCAAHLRRVRSDMGSKIQDLFQVFPMHVFRNEEIDAWIRQLTGARRVDVLDSEALSMLTFGRLTENTGPSLLHGQRSTCEVVATPVNADLSYFRAPNNPRGRSSCMLGVDPHDDDAAVCALYDHGTPDPQTFRATNNPWASQRGSLGDVMYNGRHRDRLGHNPSHYSPCAQFFTTEEIVAGNKTLFKTIDEYMLRNRDCIFGDADVQYVCVEGTNDLVERPCRFLQEAFPIQASTTQALLESQAKSPPSNLNETHFGNYIIAETIPFQQSILFNS